MLIHSLDFYKLKYRGMDLSNDPRLFAQAQYQSGVIPMKFRCLFATFWKNGITYLQTQDFNKAGGFQAYWKNIFKIAKTYKADYGTCPNKACFDVNWYKKRNKAIADPHNPLDPFNNLEHFVWCAMESIMTEWALCGCLEPSSIVKEDFETGVFTEGEFVGIQYIQLKPNYNGQKKGSLSLKNPVLDDRNTKKTTLPCPYNGDPMSTCQTTIKLLSLVPDNCEGVNRIFRKPASKKQLEATNQVIGKNRINEILVLIATWSGYENPERCTAHGKRHESISKGLGGHAHFNTTTNYILPDQQTVDAVVRAKHGFPSKIRVPLPGTVQALAPALALSPTCAPSPPPSPLPSLLPSPSPSPALPSPASSVHESPAVSIQHSFGDHSNDSVPSDCAAGNSGFMTQTFEVPNESPPPMPSNISFTTGEESSPTHYNGGRGMFAEDRPQYEEDHHCEMRYYNCPRAHRYKDPSGSQYDDHHWYKEPPRPLILSLTSNRSKNLATRYNERKPPPRYEESKLSPPPYAERKPPPRYEDCKPLPRHSYKPEYKEHMPPPCRHSYESRYEERKPPRPPSTSTRSYGQRPSLAERGSCPPPPCQDQRRVSFGNNHYYQMEDYEVQITEVHHPSSWGDVELPEWGSQIRW
eukprot:jgi/Psemu1/14738/gm1.14738_g